MLAHRVHSDWSKIHVLNQLLRNYSSDFDGMKTTVNTEYGYTNNTNRFIGVRYYNLLPEVESTFLNLVPEPLRPHFFVRYMEINTNYIPPHKQNGISVVWNFLLQTQGDTITFWNINPNETPIPFGEHGEIYKETQLKKNGTLNQESLESWLMKVSHVHSIQSLEGLRTSIVLSSTSVSMEELKSHY